MYNALEQITVDREVDIFTIARQLQVRRTEFVSTLVCITLLIIGFSKINVLCSFTHRHQNCNIYCVLIRAPKKKKKITRVLSIWHSYLYCQDKDNTKMDSLFECLTDMYDIIIFGDFLKGWIPALLRRHCRIFAKWLCLRKCLKGTIWKMIQLWKYIHYMWYIYKTFLWSILNKANVHLLLEQ